MSRTQLLRENPNFRRLWLGRAVSAFGDRISDIAIPLFIYDLTNESVTHLGLAFVVRLSASILFGLIAGVLSDRWDRRVTMIVSDIARAVLISLLTIVVVFSSPDRVNPLPWGIALTFLYTINFLSAVASQFAAPARIAAIAEAVPAEMLLEANAIDQGTVSLVGFVGYAFASFLVATIGPQITFTIDAVTFIVSALFIAGLVLPPQERKETKQEPLWDGIVAGLDIAWSNPVLRALLIISAVAPLAIGAVQPLTLPFLDVLLSADGLGEKAVDSGFALMAAVFGVGIVAGMFWVGRYGGRIYRGTLIIMGVIGVGFALLMMAALPILLRTYTDWSVPIIFAIVLQFNALSAASNAGILVGIRTLVQVSAPPQMIGRVFNVVSLVGSVMMAVGAALAFIAEFVTVYWVMIFWGAFMFLSGIFALFLKGLRDPNRIPLRAYIPTITPRTDPQPAQQIAPTVPFGYNVANFSPTGQWMGSELGLRHLILSQVSQYYDTVHAEKPFTPGETRVNYAGRVYDAAEMVNMVDAVLDFWLTAGEWSQKFEKKLGQFLGVRDVLPVNSGSSANLVAVTALCSNQLDNPLRPGDEVIVPATSFPTTVNPIIQNGLVPVFVDMNYDDFNLNVEQLEEALSKRTRAVMFAHTLGIPADLDVITAFVKKHDLYFIEDACDALGSKWDGKMVGTFGDFGTLSCYPAHHITMGEGGAVYTNRPKLAKIARSVRDWGRDCYCGYDSPVNGKCGTRFDCEVPGIPGYYDHKYMYSEIGYNLKLTDPQAAMGVAQLEKLPDFIAQRKHNYRVLDNALRQYEEFLIFPNVHPKADVSWFAFPMIVREDAPFMRHELTRFLEMNKVETRLIFAGNIVRQPAYKHVNARIVSDLTVADGMMRGGFFIGVYPGLDQQRLDYMISMFEKFFNAL